MNFLRNKIFSKKHAFSRKNIFFRLQIVQSLFTVNERSYFGVIDACWTDTNQNLRVKLYGHRPALHIDSVQQHSHLEFFWFLLHCDGPSPESRGFWNSTKINVILVMWPKDGNVCDLQKKTRVLRKKVERQLRRSTIKSQAFDFTIVWDKTSTAQRFHFCYKAVKFNL